ncbi:MAG TPA: hypothetical protein VN666_14610 [Nitrospira sp.]|nr:hypothetical protein [Nitrospira sp.]
MEKRRPVRHCLATVALVSWWGILSPPQSWSLDITQRTPPERHEVVLLADAAVRALQNNLNISLSRHTKKKAG